jgi:predicted kinase
MEIIIFIGLQGSGKSTFYKRTLSDTHVRLNLDMLKTRHREQVLLKACLEAKQPVVIDNTNPTPEDRARYIAPAKAAGFRVIGYYFQSKIEDCKRRNSQRPAKEVVPLPALLGTASRLVPPTPQEGFDELRYIRISDDGNFVQEEWNK